MKHKSILFSLFTLVAIGLTYETQSLTERLDVYSSQYGIVGLSTLILLVMHTSCCLNSLSFAKKWSCLGYRFSFSLLGEEKLCCRLVV